MAKKTVFVTVAILAAFSLDEKRYHPAQLVEFDAGTANDLADQGQVDKHKDAIAHLKAQGVAVIRHPSKDPETEADPKPGDGQPDTDTNTDDNE